MNISPKLKTATGRIMPKTARIILKDKANARNTIGTIIKGNKIIKPSLYDTSDRRTGCPAYLLFFVAVFLKVFVKVVV